MSDLDQLERLASDLLFKAAPAERRRVLRLIVRDWRRSQAARIARQQNPDGSSFAPRHASRLRRQGQVRAKAMFRKLRQAAHLKAGVDGDEGWVGFSGRDSRIARVHQDGLNDRPSPRQRPVRYARRVLIGLTDAEQERAFDIVIDQLASLRG